MKKFVGTCFKIMPEGLQKLIIKTLKKSGVGATKEELMRRLDLRVGYSSMRRYTRKLYRHWDREIHRLKNNPRFALIREKNHDNFFHGNLISGIVDKTVYAMSKGYIPLFEIVYCGRGEIRQDCERLRLDWILEQPCKSLFGIEPELVDKGDIHEIEELQKDTCPYRVEGGIFWTPECKELKIWNYLYQRILQPSENFRKYLERDIAVNNIPQKDILGILIRGTDYTKLKPKLHPVQPEVVDVINKCEEFLKRHNYQKIYVVTDEERAFNQFVEHFGKDMVLTNTRVYYDKEFRDKNCYQIADARNERENDDYLHSMEYISSLAILSKCDAIVGGNCGGSKLAVLVSEKKPLVYLFNLGVY